MINGIFTRHKTVPFASGVSGTTLIYTTTKVSMISVQFRDGQAQNGNVEVRSDVNVAAPDRLTFAVYTYGSSDDRRVFAQIVPIGTQVWVYRSRARIYLHIFEME